MLSNAHGKKMIAELDRTAKSFDPETAKKKYDAAMANWDKRAAKVRAENKQKRLNKEAERKQEQLDRLAEERTLIAQQQQAQSVALQRQMADQQAKQAAQVKGLQAEQAAKVGGIKAAGNAAASSLRALALSQPTAPTPQITRRNGRSDSPRATSSSLRIGQTSRGSGSGSNLSI